MRRLVAAFVVISIAVALLLPFGLTKSNFASDRQSFVDGGDSIAGTESVVFPPTLNTSQTVPEYSLVSRALLLPGGSTYSALADINNDGRKDLIVAVSESKAISLFYGQPGGDFLSTPSYSISLGRTPIGVAAFEPYGDGNVSLMVLEKRNSDSDTERLLILNRTTDISYSEFQNLTLYKTAIDFAIGKLNEDSYPDIAFTCPGLNPSASAGVVEIRFGPDYSTSVQFNSGKGSNAIAIGNFSGDNFQDLAVSNFYDKNITVFFQPFSIGNTPDYELSTSESNPLGLDSGDMSNDGLDDIAVVVTNPSQLLFYFQSLGSLQTSPDSTFSRSLVSENASSVFCGDLNGDSRNDILMMSALENRSFGIFQRSSAPIWPVAYDFLFSTGAMPRHALIGDLDSDSMTDIAISSARADWSGSSIAIYSARTPVTPTFSNSNTTLWTNVNWEASAIGVGDLDGDGKNDVVSIYPDGQLLGVSKQPGGVEHDTTMGFVPSKTIVSDLNGDGRADVLVSQASGSDLVLYFGRSDLSVSLDNVQIPCGANVNDFAIGFLNNDDLVDIVAVTDTGILDIFNNSGSATDPFPTVYELVPTPGKSIPAVVVGDFDTDGKDDIAYSVQNLEINVSFQKDVDPCFSAQADTVLYHSGGGAFSQLWAGDVNDDTKTDIAAMKASDSKVYLYDQEDFGSPRTPKASLNLPEAPRFVSMADFTDDGLADVVVTFSSADLLFLYKQSGGAIPADPSMVFVTGASPSCAIVGAFGQDGTQSMLVGDSSSHSVSIWRQINIPPSVSIEISLPGPFSEFDEIDLTAIVDSYHPAILFEWQFESSVSGPFVPDVTTTSSNEISHIYGHVGKFTVKVRATVSDNSSGFGELDVQVNDVVPAGVFDDFVTWQRDAANTSRISFDASGLAAAYPDIMQTDVVFGDGATQQILGGPVSAITHYYDPDMDYVVVINVTDDEWNKLTITKTLKLKAPIVLLTSPAQNSVIRAGVPIQLFMSDDSLPLSWARYCLNGGQPTNFTAEWEIDTDGWADGTYMLEVSASDGDGNIAKYNITVILDSLPPVIEVLWDVTSVHGGDSVNITVQVSDPHVNEEAVFMNVKLPGTSSYSQISLISAGNGVYFAIVEVPKRSGTLLFNITVEDLAENYASSELFSVEVKLRLMDMAWPYMLALAVLAALGTAAYFVRESKIAVDETFVIFNDGRLISHSTRHLKPGMDDQILGGMFVAIQDFVKDSFKDVTSFTLRKLEFGEKSILIEKGDHLFLAVILHGKASKKVVSKMEMIVDEIEEVYSHKLKDWDGDLDALRGVGDIAKKLYSKAPLLPPFRRSNT